MSRARTVVRTVPRTARVAIIATVAALRLAATAGDARAQPPTVPELVAPLPGSVVDVLRPVLIARDAVDPESDPLVYDWSLALDSTFANIVDGGVGQPADGSGQVRFVLASDLVEDRRYCWRVRADDGQQSSAYAAACFVVSTRNDPPSVPVPLSPSDQQGATTTTPVFSWSPSTDPEDDAISYDIEVADERGDAVGSVGGVLGTVAAIAAKLTNGATYTWRVRAIDAAGAASAFSPPATFTVSAPLDDPEVTVSDGGCVASRAPAGGALGAIGLGLVVVGVAGRRRRRRFRSE